jgi:hypothetical protein
MIQILLTVAQSGQAVSRCLLADTGAGPAHCGFDLLMLQSDCLLCGGKPAQPVVLGGAYTGSHAVYLLRARLPVLGFDRNLAVVGIPTAPAGFDGIACFAFLNRFTYGNFGAANQFGLET